MPHHALQTAQRHLAKGDLLAVRAALEQFWSSSPAQQGYADLAEFCLDAGRFNLAGEFVQALLRLGSPSESWYRLGLLFAEKGQMSGAEALLKGASTQVPDHAELWSDLGAVQWSLGSRGEAVASLKRALELDPTHPDAVANLNAIRSDVRAHHYRILCLGDANSIHTQRFVRYFADSGYDVHLLSDTHVSIPGVKVYAPEQSIPVLDFSSWMQLCQQVIRTVKPDFVHGHYASIYGLWGALSGFKPYVLTLWGSDINVDPHLSPHYKTLVRFALAQADLIMGDSSDLNLAAQNLALTAISQPNLIRFGVDTTAFRPGLTVEGLRNRYRLGSRPVVFSPRQFKPPANIHRIIEAIPRVLDSVPDTLFVLKTYATPRDEYYHQLVALAESLGVSDSIRFVEEAPHEEMPYWYNLASVTLSIRDVDAGSVSVMESLACGTPVIGSDIASNQELIDSESGVLVDPHDTRTLADNIIRFVEADPNRSDLGFHGRNRMIALADFEVNMARVEQLYDQLWRQFESHSLSKDASLTTLLARAIAQFQAGHVVSSHQTLNEAVRLGQTSWDVAQLAAGAELIEHPSIFSDENRNQLVLSQILSQAEGHSA